MSKGEHQIMNETIEIQAKQNVNRPFEDVS
jgi:hypothetical protein